MIGWSATVTFVFLDGPFGLPVQKLSYIRDECLDILDMFKEKHEVLLEVLQDSLVLAIADLQLHVLQAFHEFRSHVNKMIRNMNDSWTYQRNTSKEKWIKKEIKTFHSKRLSSELSGPQQNYVALRRFDSWPAWPCFVAGKLGKEYDMLIVAFHDAHLTDFNKRKPKVTHIISVRVFFPRQM